MKMLHLVPFAAAFLAATAFASAKEVTLTGAGQCAKCSLKQTDSCQNAVVVKEAGKDTTYLMAKNDVAQKFHGSVCKGVKQVTVTGTVSEKDGKKVITASKVAEVKS
ncbi:MAG: DUF6370 family protein [Opitutaceae bacterium]